MFSQFSPGPQRSAGHSLGERPPALEHHCSDVSRARSTLGAPPALRLGPSRVWGFLISLWHRAGVAWAVRAARPLAAFTRRSGLGSGVSSRPGEGLSWRWPLPWDKRVYLGGVVLFCIHNCGLVSDPYSWNATGMSSEGRNVMVTTPKSRNTTSVRCEETKLPVVGLLWLCVEAPMPPAPWAAAWGAAGAPPALAAHCSCRSPAAMIPLHDRGMDSKLAVLQ